MAAITTTLGKPQSRASRVLVAVAMVVAAAAVVTLGVLIVRELLPRSATRRAVASATREAPVVETALQVAPTAVPVRPVRAPTAVAPSAAPAPSSSGAAAPLPASLFAQLAADPEAFGPTTVFSPPAGKEQVYQFETLPPYSSTTLRRTKANPTSWQLDTFHGPKLNDLGPEGAVHQAAVAKDPSGGEMTWYVIDSGPLAQAYAVKDGRALRVMSRDYLLANRADLPAEIASTLDK